MKKALIAALILAAFAVIVWASTIDDHGYSPVEGEPFELTLIGNPDTAEMLWRWYSSPGPEYFDGEGSVIGNIATITIDIPACTGGYDLNFVLTCIPDYGPVDIKYDGWDIEEYP